MSLHSSKNITHKTKISLVKGKFDNKILIVKGKFDKVVSYLFMPLIIIFDL